MAKQAASIKDISPLAKLYAYTNNLISTMEVIPTAERFPSFAQLKSSPDKFYELFSNATYNYNVICDALQKLQHTNAMIVKTLNDLLSPECSEGFESKSQYTKKFTAARTECLALISAYETAKASSESVVKFYNSAQYVITSGRFTGTHADY